MEGATPFARVAILGTGLVGGSFGLALRRQFPEMSVVGWDRAEVLQRAQERGIVQEAVLSFAKALLGADLVYLALPVAVTMELLPAIAGAADPRALVTDACSTKAAICRLAEKQFHGRACFLGGHPIAGKELSGADQADAELFLGTKYILAGSSNDPDPRIRQFGRIVRAIGAAPVWCDAETHDWAMAVVSHLPQLVAVALAEVVAEETDETGLPISLAGRGLRDLLRIAGSPYEIWRDICLTNADNIARSLDRLVQAIDHLRTRLASRELEDSFRTANEVYKSLHNLQ